MIQQRYMAQDSSQAVRQTQPVYQPTNIQQIYSRQDNSGKSADAGSYNPLSNQRLSGKNPNSHPAPNNQNVDIDNIEEIVDLLNN